MESLAHDPVSVFGLLADETRLRILRALMAGPLTVGELTEVLSVPQSTVSRHLGALRRGELVSDRRDGTYIWYSVADLLRGDGAFFPAVRDALARLPQAEADSSRLQAVLEARKARTRDFFDALAGSYHQLAQPGGGAEGLALAMLMALPPSTVADLGSGQGEIALRLARLGHRVLAVDSSPAMIRRLEERAAAEGLREVQAHVGDVESLPLPEACCDVALLSHTLHHAHRPQQAVAEAVRIVRPGGRVVLLDLLRHEQEWVRERLGDLWLGFDPAVLQRWMEEAGLKVIAAETAEVEGGLPVVGVVGTRPTA